MGHQCTQLPRGALNIKTIVKSMMVPSKLIGKYNPNVTAKPFQFTLEYFGDVHKLTNSASIGQTLANWGKLEDLVAMLVPPA